MTLRVNHFLTGYLYSLLLRKTEACMKLISRRDRERLIEKGRERRSLSTRDKSLPYSLGSPRISPGDSVFLPVVLLRSPDKSTLWLLTDIHEFNHDRAYGLRYTAWRRACHQLFQPLGACGYSRQMAPARRAGSRVSSEQKLARLCVRAAGERMHRAAESARLERPRSATSVPELGAQLPCFRF